MPTFTRRKLFSGLTSTLLATSSPACAIASATRAISEMRPFDERDYPHGCLLARKAGSSSVRRDGNPPGSSIDFWTFRVSEIESSELPLEIAQIVIWDEVFSRRSLAKNVRDIFDALPRYYGFELAASSNTFAFHLDEFSALGSVVTKLLADSDSVRPSSRIALIDIDSCGVSRLEWSDILPHLRPHYDLVIGLAHFAGRGPPDWYIRFGDDAGLSSLRAAMARCDLVFLTSDASLGFDDILTHQARSSPLNKLVRELIFALSSSDFRDAVRAMESGELLVSGVLSQQSLNSIANADIVESQITSGKPANVST